MVEWKVFLQRSPGSVHAEHVKALLVEAEAAAGAEQGIPRPGSEPAGGAKKDNSDAGSKP